MFHKFISQPVDRVIHLINQILHCWTNYFRIGNSSRCFGYVRDWVERLFRYTRMNIVIYNEV
ncbi:group II intron maturase-specific domain-containing protein [Orientia tsutsugamushi]|uniref:group II intron maturase-specific domain-containing protein n=1 Tax=Orientia tsutsugamushi TaxID=784 RepID=UPI004046D7C5